MRYVAFNIQGDDCTRDRTGQKECVVGVMQGWAESEKYIQGLAVYGESLPLAGSG